MKVRLVNENFRDNYVANLLYARGVKSIDDFFDPPRECLQDPGALKNIGMGAALFRRVVHTHGRILVIVDADADGYCSASIICQYIKCLEPECPVDWWLHEGKQHGLQDHIERLTESDIHYDLVICPDSSTNDKEFHDQLSALKTPCLICDHHLASTEFSDNAVIINNQISPDYTNKELTGSGVTWQFCRYIDQLEGTNYANNFMDLAAFGIVGDMSEMTSLENRYIVKHGFSKEGLKNSFLLKLVAKQSYSITGKMYATDDETIAALNPISIAFYLVPLINAMIRVGTMAEKERTFIALIDGARSVPSSKRGAKGALERVDIEAVRECGNAKNRQNRIKEQATTGLEAKIFKYDLLSNKILFIELDDNDDFPSELNGLIANYFTAKYQRPTIIARRGSDGFIKGSARGLNQSELTDFRQTLLDTGLMDFCEGHANAFGASIPAANVAKLHELLNTQLADVDFGENYYNINFARWASDDDLPQLINDLARAKNAWGQGCPEPYIYVDSIPLTKIQVMGANEDTVKIEYNGIAYMKFHAQDLIDALRCAEGKGARIKIVGRANLNEYGGKITPQIFIEDYEIDENNITSF